MMLHSLSTLKNETDTAVFLGAITSNFETRCFPYVCKQTPFTPGCWKYTLRAIHVPIDVVPVKDHQLFYKVLKENFLNIANSIFCIFLFIFIY